MSLKKPAKPFEIPREEPSRPIPAPDPIPESEPAPERAPEPERVPEPVPA